MSRQALQQVRQLVHQRAYGEALRRSLDVWRSGRQPEVGELVLRLSDVVQRRRPPIAGSRVKDRQEDWLARAAARQPEDLGLLLDHLMDDNSRLATARVDALAGWPADPRIAHRLLDHLEELRFSSTTTVWTRLTARIVEHGDAGTEARLAALVSAWEKDPPVRTTSMERILGSARRAHRNCRNWVASQPSSPLDEAARKRVAAIAAALPGDPAAAASRTVDEFLNAIGEAPGDDAPKRVFADYLLEHGEPWGELIQLQFQLQLQDVDSASARRTKARINKLLARHWRDALGPLAPVLVKKNLVFEKGFPAVCQLRRGLELRTLDEALGDPRWTTIRDLHLNAWITAVNVRVAEHASLSSLRTLRQAPALSACRLAQGPGERAIESLSVDRFSWNVTSPGRVAEVFSEAAGLPRLRSLALNSGRLTAGQIVRVLAGLGDRLTDLSGLVWPLDELPELCGRLAGRTGAFRGQLTVETGLIDVTLSCSGGGEWTGLRLAFSRERATLHRYGADWETFRDQVRLDLEELPRVLRKLPSGALRRVELVRPVEVSEHVLRVVQRLGVECVVVGRPVDP